MFKVERLDISGAVSLYADEKSFISLVVIDGEGVIENGGDSLKLKKGDSVFVTAGSGEITLSGGLSVIKTTV